MSLVDHDFKHNKFIYKRRNYGKPAAIYSWVWAI